MSAASFADWLKAVPDTPNTPPKMPGVQPKNAAVIGENTPITPNTPNTPQKQQGQVENAKTRAAANDPAHHRPELAQGTAPTAPAPGPQGLDPGHDALLAMAMRFCDATHASDKARADWQRDVLETPPELRQGLYNYLREQLRPVNLLWRNQK